MTDPRQLAIVRGLQAFQRAQQLHAEKRYADAAEQYRQALASQPTNLKFLAEYARLAEDAQNWDGVERLCRRILELKPDALLEGRVAFALFAQGKYAEAEHWYRRHVERFPDEVNGLHGLGTTLSHNGDWEGSIRCGERAYAISPEPRHLDLVLNGYYHLADRAKLDHFLDEGFARFPDTGEVRSVAFLHYAKSRDYARAFDYLQDFRWRNDPDRRADGGVPGDWWDGRPFDGVLLVGGEQGLGDEIIASSMFGDLARLGQRALIECDERLVPIYRRSFPALLEFVPRHQGLLAKAHAAGGNFRKILALDLARFFRRGLDAFPARTAWLVPDAQRVERLRAAYRARWPGRRLAGISWKSKRTMEGRGNKSLDLDDVVPLLDVPDTTWINLQYGDVADDLAQLAAMGAPPVFVDPDIDTTRDIDAFLAQVAALDVVVSVSNTTVHIAGAVGTPCHVLLPKTHPVLWYWGYEGERTPWYPSLRLWRSPRDDDWRELVEAVRAAVRAAGPGA